MTLILHVLGPCIRLEGEFQSPKSVTVINSALDNQTEDQDAPANKRKKGTLPNSGYNGPLAGILSGVNDLEQRVRVLTGFGHRGHHTSTLSSRYLYFPLHDVFVTLCLFLM